MTNEQILKKAIEKANKNGYKAKGWEFQLDSIDALLKSKTYFILIFSHDFAKAFWGEEEVYDDNNVEPGTGGDYYVRPKWQIHLQQMVLEEQPLQYLKKFL